MTVNRIRCCAYRNQRPDWVKTRWPFYFLPANESLATVPGLEREMRARVDMAMLDRVLTPAGRGALEK